MVLFPFSPKTTICASGAHTSKRSISSSAGLPSRSGKDFRAVGLWVFPATRSVARMSLPTTNGCLAYAAVAAARVTNSSAMVTRENDVRNNDLLR